MVLSLNLVRSTVKKAYYLLCLFVSPDKCQDNKFKLCVVVNYSVDLKNHYVA